MHRSTLPVTLLAIALVGCATAQVKPFTRFYAGGQPSIAGIAPSQARLMFSIAQNGSAPRKVQAIGGLAFASASVSLSNTSAAVLPATLTKPVTFVDGSASSVFTALRPGGNYAVNISLFNNANQQVGSGVHENIELPAGQTTAVTIVIGQDGNVALSSSQVGNGFGTTGNYVITKGDTVVFNTGFAGNEAAVDHWSVFLSPELSNPAAKTKIATFPNTTPFSTFSWSTGTANLANGCSYSADTLTTTGNQNGSLIFELYDASNNVLGRSTLAGVSAVAGANMNLQLQ